MTERNPDRKIQLHGKGISPISGFLITFRWFAVTASGPRGQLRHRAERQGCLPSREKCGDAPSIPGVRRRVGLRHPKASLWASRSLSGTQRPPRPAPPTAQALSKAGGASCPDTQGARQPPSKADEASPPGLAPQPAFGGPGISGRLASRPGIHLTPPATALITRVGPAGQRPAGSLPGVRLKTKRRAVGDPDTNYLHLRSQGVLGRLLPLDQKQTGNRAGGSAGGGLPSGGGRQGHPSASSPALYA